MKHNKSFQPTASVAAEFKHWVSSMIKKLTGISTPIGGISWKESDPKTNIYDSYFLSMVMHKPLLNMSDSSAIYHQNLFNDFAAKLGVKTTLNAIFINSIINPRSLYKEKEDTELLMAVALNMKNYDNSREEVYFAIESMLGKEALYAFRIAKYIIFLTVRVEFEDKIQVPDEKLNRPVAKVG